MKKFWYKAGFLLAVLVLFIAMDLGLRASGWVESSGLFPQNDFEITCRKHPEPVWEGVIYGSSELISSYREDLSESGYVNLGMDYATMEDLYEILDGGYVTVGDELILALNWCLVCDELDTNPTYVWHKGALEPWCYFQRDRIFGLIRDDAVALLNGKPLRQATHLADEKIFYYGRMTDEEHARRMERLNELYFSKGMEGFDENLDYLGRVLDWCAGRGIRVRALWLPEDPERDLGPVNDRVREECAGILEAHGIELYDMRGMFPSACFHDTGHFEYDAGAPLFTKELDKWILSSKSGKP